MSIPAHSMLGAVYRNDLEEVGRFFETLHSEHYVIVNLCETKYSATCFGDRLYHIPMDDHSIAPLETIINFCEWMYNYLSLDERNVVAVHCKGGKGRTGLMICCWLIYSEFCDNVPEALSYFENRRTDPTLAGKGQGVETASQVRFVRMFYELVRGAPIYPRLNLFSAEMCVVSVEVIKE